MNQQRKKNRRHAIHPCNETAAIPARHLAIPFRASASPEPPTHRHAARCGSLGGGPGGFSPPRARTLSTRVLATQRRGARVEGSAIFLRASVRRDIAPATCLGYNRRGDIASRDRFGIPCARPTPPHHERDFQSHLGKRDPRGVVDVPWCSSAPRKRETSAPSRARAAASSARICVWWPRSTRTRASRRGERRAAHRARRRGLRHAGGCSSGCGYGGGLPRLVRGLSPPGRATPTLRAARAEARKQKENAFFHDDATTTNTTTRRVGCYFELEFRSDRHGRDTFSE